MSLIDTVDTITGKRETREEKLNVDVPNKKEDYEKLRDVFRVSVAQKLQFDKEEVITSLYANSGVYK